MGGGDSIQFTNKLKLKLWLWDAREKGSLCAWKKIREGQREVRMERMGRERSDIMRHCTVVIREMGEAE